jgi:hypothetical protein
VKISNVDQDSNVIRDTQIPSMESEKENLKCAIEDFLRDGVLYIIEEDIGNFVGEI